MDYDEYLSRVKANFNSEKNVEINGWSTKMFYEEKFEIKWIATKLKIFSFLTCIPHITAQDISQYSSACVSHALNTYKGLPRGFQNGVGSFNVIASEKIDAQAITFATSRPKKHFAAFEMPIIYNLSNNEIIYYEKTPMWGAIYYKFFRETIEKNFNVH